MDHRGIGSETHQQFSRKHYFLSLTTGQHLNQVHATPLPIPDDVIECVHALAR